MRALLLLAFLLLAACGTQQPENVQQRAANASVALEARYNEIQAEAENDTADAATPVENEADALLNQMNGAAADNLALNAH
ncbi:MAG TPA: hypothetical protein VGD66_14395 [Allosphingosinicella sp.]|jgi:outer membrane lipopolysaccharide assembly protein LptE/RlpB